MSPEDAAERLIDAVQELAVARGALEQVETQMAVERFKVLEPALIHEGQSVAAAERMADLATAALLPVRNRKALEVRVAEDRVAMLHTLAARNM